MSNKYTATQILGFKRYSDLFTDDHKKELKLLQHEWHPDRNKDPKANDVFAHIMQLYNMTNTPIKVSDVAYVNLKGQECTFKYFTSETLAFGKAYYTNGAVCYVFNQDSEFLIEHFKKNLKTIGDNIKKDDKLKAGYEYSLPEIYEVASPANILILKIPKDHVPLSLVFKYCKNAINTRTSTWIISRMFDFSMMLHVSGLVGNGFSMSTVFVDLAKHRAFDLTSYFYAVENGSKLHALNADSIDFYPLDCLTSKKAMPKCDIALIKKLGIQILGDLSGTGNKLKFDTAIPQSISEFLTAPVSNDKLKLYDEWQHEVAVKAFGARGFFKYEIDTALLLNQ